MRAAIGAPCTTNGPAIIRAAPTATRAAAAGRDEAGLRLELPRQAVWVAQSLRHAGLVATRGGGLVEMRFIVADNLGQRGGGKSPQSRAQPGQEVLPGH